MNRREERMFHSYTIGAMFAFILTAAGCALLQDTSKNVATIYESLDSVENLELLDSSISSFELSVSTSSIISEQITRIKGDYLALDSLLRVRNIDDLLEDDTELERLVLSLREATLHIKQQLKPYWYTGSEADRKRLAGYYAAASSAYISYVELKEKRDGYYAILKAIEVLRYSLNIIGAL